MPYLGSLAPSEIRTVDHPLEQAFLVPQVLEPAILDDAALVHHDDPVAVLHRGKPMGDEHRRLARQNPAERLLHHPLADRVQCTGRLVKHEVGGLV